MGQTRTTERVTRRVSFLRDEDELLQKRAAEAGMTVSSYIHHQAVHGRVVSVDWDRLRDHSEQIGRIHGELLGYIQSHSGDLWLYGTDLDMIRKTLDALLESEVRLMGLVSGETEGGI